MARVKFNVNTEYAYIQNFKILQSMRSESLVVARTATEETIRCIHEAYD